MENVFQFEEPGHMHRGKFPTLNFEEGPPSLFIGHNKQTSTQNARQNNAKTNTSFYEASIAKYVVTENIITIRV